MSESFTITVALQGKEREFATHWQQVGYTHRFTVDIDGVTIYFEPDEEGSYRAMAAPEQEEKAVLSVDKDWLEAIRQTLQEA